MTGRQGARLIGKFRISALCDSSGVNWAIMSESIAKVGKMRKIAAPHVKQYGFQCLGVELILSDQIVPEAGAVVFDVLAVGDPQERVFDHESFRIWQRQRLTNFALLEDSESDEREDLKSGKSRIEGSRSGAEEGCPVNGIDRNDPGHGEPAVQFVPSNDPFGPNDLFTGQHGDPGTSAHRCPGRISVVEDVRAVVTIEPGSREAYVSSLETGNLKVGDVLQESLANCSRGRYVSFLREEDWQIVDEEA